MSKELTKYTSDFALSGRFVRGFSHLGTISEDHINPDILIFIHHKN